MIEDLRLLVQKIFKYPNRGIRRIDFLQETSKIITDFSGCDAVELRFREGNRIYRCKNIKEATTTFQVETVSCSETEDSKITSICQNNRGLERLCCDVIQGNVDLSMSYFTKNGSFWTGDIANSFFIPNTDGLKSNNNLVNVRSLAMIPLSISGKNSGILQLKSTQPDFFTEDKIKFYELIAQVIGFALDNQQTQAALHERVKELTCLYGISQICEQDGVSLEAILQDIVEHLPLAWQYPEIAFGKIILDGRSYLTSGFREGHQKLTSDIVVNSIRRGNVEVVYTKDKPEIDEGPFLKEERTLMNTIAAQIESIIQRKQAEEDKLKLSEQLRHADRLATIGQLAAGVAHELNEPLGNILGFAQLAKKYSGLPAQPAQDIDKIVQASLHAREIIKKLMLFARQTPMKTTKVNLNNIVQDGLYLLESRCAKEGVELVRMLAPNLSEITADSSQLHQVLVNLVVNAIQAMSKGDRLTVQTLEDKDYISLIIEDTGVGMSDEIIKQIFIPFFTTKDVGQGTGLGLPVVHGIVTSHGGTINVASKVGQGTQFNIKLPKNGKKL